jgi:branched-subunit amino acid aminotransferase/4-amino-4-deoxychorismate lyase
VASFRVAASDRVVQHKTASRLLNVLAAAEARERGADNALFVNTDGHVTEGTSSNVFWIENGKVFTPPISAGLLPGVTRAIVFELCAELGLDVKERTTTVESLFESEGVFLTFTTRGVVEVTTLDKQSLRTSPLTKILAEKYRALVRGECA